MTTFGSTLSDLQAGINTAQGIDYQRANFQDQINAQRLSDFLRARSEQNRTQALRDADMARIVEARNAREMQDRQFDVQQRNLMELGRLEQQTRKDVANIAAANRAIDPRAYQSFADIQALNNENFRDVQFKKQLSNARKAAVAERERIKSNQRWFAPSFRGSEGGLFDFGEPDDPRWKQLNEVIAGLDAQASSLGLGPAADGGYVVPDYTPIEVPAMFDPNRRLTLDPNQPAAVVTPVTPSAAVAAPAAGGVEVVPGGIFQQLQDANQTLDFQGAGIRTPAFNLPQPLPESPTRRIRITPDGRAILAQ